MRLTFLLSTTLLVGSLVWGCAEEGTPARGTTGGNSEVDDAGDSDDSDDTKTDSASPGSGKKDAGRVDAGKVTADAGKKPTDTTGKDAGPSAPKDAATSDAGGEVATFEGPFTLPDFANLAPPLGEPLDPKASSKVTPAAPTGWVWYDIPGAICRDGSPTGFYVHFAESDSLLVYLEGGGACTSPGFCAYNPKNVNQVLSGDGQTLIGSVGGATSGRQQPGKDGIFALGNAQNPFKDWSMVYIPYCTGDVHFGTRTNVMVPGVDEKQQFVGYRNMEKFVARLAPTFQDKAKQVVLTGASAGGFGASLNYSLVQDTFKDARVMALDDSGPPFPDKIEPVCMQKKWRELWGFADSFPKDCKECQQADGGGLGNFGVFLQKKHPNYTFASLSSTQDEVIRSFYAPGLDNCSGFDTGDPATAVLFSFPAEQYTEGLLASRAQYLPSKAFASYYINGAGNKTYHQHLWRPRFYEAAQGNVTIAAWVKDFISGKMTQVGP
ncbi:MAG: hypothetical protein RLZZ450_4043 [Pseudomonadota bacterium]|jgi:hypothetical protein